MILMPKQLLAILLLFVPAIFLTTNLMAQPILQPWGNVSGIRIDGELMKIESNITVIKSNGSIQSTGKERQRPHYTRNGDQQIVTTILDSLYFTEAAEGQGRGVAKIKLSVTAHADESLKGIYFTFLLNDEDYAKGTAQINHSKPVQLSADENSLNRYFKGPVKTMDFISQKRQMKIIFPEPVPVFIKPEETKGAEGLRVFIPIHKGDLKKGSSDEKTFVMKASGVINQSPVTLTLKPNDSGRKFIGFGGNFRLQNPRTDPQVIDYCLKNMDVRFSRVEMPWQLWQPEMDKDPIAEANAGHLNGHVEKSMEMAQRLYQKGIPVILSAWSAPAWAVVGKPKYGPDSSGVWGNPLDHSKTAEIYRSIADYILYLKEKYGVEISLFSFNESDLGINIRQTGAEHAELIKGLGAYFVSRGLKTKMLLGDNSDATTYRFIYPAMDDPETYPNIGAISFHSWRGWDPGILQKWADAATKLKKPLIVAEGSIDAQAWGYPMIFKEPEYALNEINLYVRLLSICQPEAILQWQLTADYSPLSGGGIFGDTTALRPTQRFWNLKQLASTPQGLKAISIQGEAANISAAALGDNEKGVYAIHLVNNGATRQVTLTGLPQKMKSLRIFVTDQNQNMKAGKQIPVTNGVATFTLDKTSFTSLFSE